MRPRYAADYRTLLWALVLLPGVPALTYLAPSLLPFTAVAALYTSFCTGVLAHNHVHCPVFHSRTANTVYSCWLSAFYGCPLFAWIPTHTQNHHRYTNGDGDETRTSRHTEHDTVWAALTYPLKCARWQLPSVVRHFHKQRARGRARALYAQLLVLAAAQLAALVLGVRQHGTTLGLVLYGTVVLGPALLAPYLMMLTNYFQHVGCDANSPHDHSRNFVSSFWNWCVFDNGYHTAHHDRPGLHWSRLRDAHARRSHLISPHLNQSTPVAYCAASYGPVGNARRRSTRTQAKAASMSS